ncbi:hypothetical protein CEXT_553541 [Caerostris extrusa]|uniref:Uncharacterized protein n=1 Tax=Caerostris extrusa TaxID=172846 RepID=A0AAV4VAF3_CAEEX|nr:hypothetical protein CEXT_553541 [Caerostris extrusa]
MGQGEEISQQSAEDGEQFCTSRMHRCASAGCGQWASRGAAMGDCPPKIGRQKFPNRREDGRAVHWSVTCPTPQGQSCCTSFE